jgi:predicted ribosomally synthesized peptide with SipW-like signal peptide
MKSKKTLIAIGAVIALALIGGSIAYFTGIVSFENNFHVSTYQSQTTESFTSPNDWKPCDVTPKEISVTNSGNIAIGARVKLEDYWKDKNGNDLADLTENGVKLTAINFHSGWEQKWELRDGWYVFKTTLAPGESTGPLIDSVSLSCNANFAGDIVFSANGLVGESGNTAYSGAFFHVNATIQTIQADAISEWD